MLISPKSSENKEDTELLKTTARQRGMDEQQHGMSQKKPAFKRELFLALDLKQVCLCSVETVETTLFSDNTCTNALSLFQLTFRLLISSG